MVPIGFASLDPFGVWPDLSGKGAARAIQPPDDGQEIGIRLRWCQGVVITEFKTEKTIIRGGANAAAASVAAPPADDQRVRNWLLTKHNIRSVDGPPHAYVVGRATAEHYTYVTVRGVGALTRDEAVKRLMRDIVESCLGKTVLAVNAEPVCVWRRPVEVTEDEFGFWDARARLVICPGTDSPN